MKQVDLVQHDEPARQGRLEAEVFDLRLRLAEAQAREARLRLLWGTPEQAPGVVVADAVAGDDLETATLRQQIEHYAAYTEAINRSAGWRTIKWLRRVAGRRWAQPSPPDESRNGEELDALRAQLDDYARFIQAVHASRGWRFLQRLRSLTGRRW